MAAGVLRSAPMPLTGEVWGAVAVEIWGDEVSGQVEVGHGGLHSACAW
jgi:hypothetical protein